MTIFRKKLLLLLLALLAAVGLGLGLIFMPAKKSSAAEVVLDKAEHFKIDSSGTLTGLSDEGNAEVGTNNFSIELPDSVKLISQNAFAGNTKLVSVKIPSSVTQIGPGAFSGCIYLTDVEMPGIDSIPNNLFQNCYRLEKLNAAGAREFNIPESVTTIGDNAFYSCVAIKNLTIPAKVSQIGSSAFFGLEGATEINYLAERANLKEQASPFAMADAGYGRVKVTVNIGDGNHPIALLPVALFSGHKAVKEVNLNNLQLPGGVEDFGFSVFKDCTSLAKVTFADNCNVPVINQEAFSGCISLHSVIGLEKIGLQTIGEKAFSRCRSLNTVSLGATVTSIGESAFQGCERLIEVENLSSLTMAAGDDATKNGGVTQHAKHVYSADGESWISEDANGFVFYADITNTANPDIQLLGYTGSLANVTLPSAFVKGGASYTKYSIYKYAFIGNTSMQKLWLPATAPNVVVIGSSAFEDCTALTEVALPKGVSEIASRAFAGCSALETVNFNGNDSISKIDSYAFQNCTSLASITIPKSVININSYAFSGCSKLTIVTFTPTAPNSKTYSLKSLEDHAFANCIAMTAIDIPASANKIGEKCFEGCSNLQYVYLPSNAGNTTVTYGDNVFADCNEDLVIVSANKAQYTQDKDVNLKNKLPEKSKLTYLVTVELIYDDNHGEDTHTIQKLYAMPGDLEQTGNGLNWVSTNRMPRQGHVDVQQYSISKWFNNEQYEQEITLEAFTGLLAGDNSGTIKLYARYFAHPKLNVTGNLVFNDNAKYSIKDILKSEVFKENGSPIGDSRADELINNFNISIVSHINADGNDDNSWNWTSGKEITDAGTYKMQITLPTDGSYGVWMENYSIDFTINPGEKNITDLIIWKTDSGALAPSEGKETLYFFDGQSTPYLTPQVVGYDDEGSPIYQTAHKDVLTSYAVYSGSEVVIKLDMSKLSPYAEIIGQYISNSGTEAGTYVAQVTLKPHNNYMLTFSESTDNSLLRGLKFEKRSDGTVVVYKTWYIAISDVNQLLSRGEGSGLFEIPETWSYMDGSQIPLRPMLSKLNEKSQDILKFTLEFTDPHGKTLILCDRESIDSYEAYMNASMPAGQYRMTFYISAAMDESTNSVVTGDPAGKTFNFTVREITVTGNDRTGVASKLVDFDARSEDYASDELKFASIDGIPLFNKPQADKDVGIWKNYPEYYTPFEIRYRVVRVGSENTDPNYYTLEEYKAGGANMIKPQAIGSYIIYYKIEAPNYSESVDGSYNLNVTYTLNPQLPEFDFKDANVLNGVVSVLKSSVSDDLNYFEIYTMLDYSKLDPSDSLNRETALAPEPVRGRHLYKNVSLIDEYKEVGEHYLFLKIKDAYSAYILWDKVNGAVDAMSGYLVLAFNVVAADNSEKVALSVKEWEYGRFDESVNKPVWALVFGDNYARYKFTLQPKAGGDSYFYGNVDAAAVAGRTFNDAPAGEYILFAEDQGDTAKGFKAYRSAGIDVTVHKVNIYFDEAPYVSGWTYGTLTGNTKISLDYTIGSDIDASVANGIEIKYIKAEDYRAGKTPGALSALVKDGYVPAGEYYLVLVRAESDNVAALSYAVKFTVLQAQNYWETSPSMPDWTYGEFNESLIPAPVPHFGKNSTMLVEYRLAGGTWVSLSEILQNGQFAVGSYEMRVRLVLSSDDQKNFTALDPVIVSFTVHEAGTQPGGIVENPSDKAGDDGISNGAVIGAIVVFAVIACAVIVAFVIVTVMANKKANAEYIKTVKSEMKRR